MCQQRISRFQIRIRQNFLNWSSFRMMKKHDETTSVQIWVVFVTVHKCSDKGLFSHLSTALFAVNNFGNTSAVRLIFSFKIFNIWCRFQKCTTKLTNINCLGDNCIWIDCVKQQILPRENTCHNDSIC